MRSLLTVQVENEVVLEFDRNTRLPGRQRDFLDKMDEDMDQGIEMSGYTISQPDTLERARYVTMHLLQALDNGDQGMISAACSYLIQRVPALSHIQVKYDNQNDRHFELIFDDD